MTNTRMSNSPSRKTRPDPRTPGTYATGSRTARRRGRMADPETTHAPTPTPPREQTTQRQNPRSVTDPEERTGARVGLERLELGFGASLVTCVLLAAAA